MKPTSLSLYSLEFHITITQKNLKKIQARAQQIKKTQLIKLTLTHRFQVKFITTDLIIDFLLTLTNPSKK